MRDFVQLSQCFNTYIHICVSVSTLFALFVPMHGNHYLS